VKTQKVLSTAELHTIVLSRPFTDCQEFFSADPLTAIGTWGGEGKVWDEEREDRRLASHDLTLFLTPFYRLLLWNPSFFH